MPTNDMTTMSVDRCMQTAMKVLYWSRWMKMANVKQEILPLECFLKFSSPFRGSISVWVVRVLTTKLPIFLELVDGGLRPLPIPAMGRQP